MTKTFLKEFETVASLQFDNKPVKMVPTDIFTKDYLFLWIESRPNPTMIK